MKNSTKLAVLLASAAMLTVSAASIVSAKGWVQQGGSWYYQNADGDLVTEEIVSSGNSKFYMGEDGAMVTDYFLESYGNSENQYYFGANGAMVTNMWVAIDTSKVSNQGDYVPDAYWYYFQATGKAVKASSSGNVKKTTIDGKKYAFNEYGQLLTGWFTADGTIKNDEEDPWAEAIYYGGADNDGVLKSGWMAVHDAASDHDDFSDREVLYFYFNPSNNKKYGGEESNTQTSSANGLSIAYVTKKISGKTYAFATETGVMLAKWEGYNATKSAWYFSDETDGSRKQKGWVYAVPAYEVSASDYNDDEEKYMYFTNNGDIVKDQIKKIGGKYYGFDANGIMKTGLVAYVGGKYEAAFNSDNTKGSELSKENKYRDKDNNEKTFDVNENNLPVGSKNTGTIAIHYFGSDGSRRTGSNVLNMADDDYTFGSNNSGHYQGLKNKKYYSNGILLKASSDIRYGLIPSSDSNARKKLNYDDSTDFYVLNTSAQKVKGSNTSKKDADGNYWLIRKNGQGTHAADTLVAVYTVDVKYDNSLGEFCFKGDLAANTYANKSDEAKGSSALSSNTKSNAWIQMTSSSDTKHYVDSSNNYCTTERNKGSYQVDLKNNDDYALNFTWNK